MLNNKETGDSVADGRSLWEQTAHQLQREPPEKPSVLGRSVPQPFPNWHPHQHTP